MMLKMKRRGEVENICLFKVVDDEGMQLVKEKNQQLRAGKSVYEAH